MLIYNNVSLLVKFNIIILSVILKQTPMYPPLSI